MLTSRRHVLALLGATVVVPLQAKPYVDVLDTPARMTALAPKAPLLAVARAGDALVAAGPRGHVLHSGDNGQTWQQAKVPVSSDLVALSFAGDKLGWAVGHDGVILHSSDAGATWSVQMDGRRMRPLFAQHADRLFKAGSISDAMQGNFQRLGEQGAENPWLDVCFLNARQGYVVGAFGQAMSTLDGGHTWEPIMHLIDNPKTLHLYAVRAIGEQVYIVGEQGLMLKLNTTTGRFEPITLPYEGTLFGVVGDASTLLVHGLRGKALRSTDGGANWEEVPTGLQVGLTAATITADGRWLLASQAGHILMSKHAAQGFALVKQERMTPIAAIAAAPGKHALITAGARGLQSIQLS